MQCSVTLERNINGGNIVKMVNNIKNTCKKDYNLDNIVDQQCTRFQEVTDHERTLRAGMPTCSINQTEAVRRYYAAFPALKKGQESPLQYYLPPPAWCRKSDTDPKSNMQSDMSMIKDWNSKKKFSCKERRNSYHGTRKTKKRCNSYSRSFESKDSLPEWVTHEGVWDMETQDPVREFIRALALDEGYGTCENTVAEESRAVPWAALEPRPRSPTDEELYAKFEAKFDRSLEALWNDTPDDEYQDLPIDFHDLLASPSDNLFAGEPSLESVWSASPPLHARLRPLRLEEPLDPFLLCEVDDVAGAMRSLAAINHSRECSGFAEVPPRRRVPAPPAAPRAPLPRPDDPLTSARTHFRPIDRQPETGARYTDGDTFDIRGELETVAFHRSASGGVYLEGSLDRYLEYRAEKSIDYNRLRLTAEQRCPDLEDPAFRLRFPLRQQDAGVQTEAWCEECCAKSPAADDLAEWEQLLADIDAQAAAPDRKRRHSAALRCADAARCPHPHARLLACCSLAQDRPLTR